MFLKVGDHVINESSIHHIVFMQDGRARVALTRCAEVSPEDDGVLELKEEEARKLHSFLAHNVSRRPPEVTSL